MDESQRGKNLRLIRPLNWMVHGDFNTAESPQCEVPSGTFSTWIASSPFSPIPFRTGMHVTPTDNDAPLKCKQQKHSLGTGVVTHLLLGSFTPFANHLHDFNWRD